MMHSVRLGDPGLLLLLLAICGCNTPFGSRCRSEAIKNARAEASDMGSPGIKSTLFSAEETCKLIGVNGASFVLKCPDTEKEAVNISVRGQTYQKGQILSPEEYISWRTPDKYMTATWLIDVSCMEDLFSTTGTQRAVFFYQCRAVEGDPFYERFAFRVELPSESSLGDNATGPVFISQYQDAKVHFGEEIPLAIWSVRTQDQACNSSQDICSIAENSLWSFLISIKIDMIPRKVLPAE